MAKGVRADFSIQGDLALMNLLRELPQRVESKATRAAVTAMMTPIARAAKAKAPRESGLLKKAIGKKVKKGRKAMIGLVGARGSIAGTYKGQKRVPKNYIHLVELGTQAHAIGNQQHPGTAAQPFLEPAYRETKSSAEAAGLAKLRESIEKEAAKLGK